MQSANLLLLFALAAPGQREPVDRIVAVVNDDVVIESELEQTALQIPQATRAQVLEQLINERLMMQQIAEAKIEVTEDDIARSIQDILRTNRITEAELKAAIESRGMSMAQYKEDLKSQLIRLKLIQMKVHSRVVIPEAEIKAEYERRTRDDSKEVLVRIRHVFLRWGESPDPNERLRVLTAARAARQRVVGGEAFADVAKEVSQSPTAASGGDLGEMSQDGMLPALAKGIEGLKEGDVSEPIETDSGVHVVLLESRRRKAAVAYADARLQIYQELYQKEVEAQMKVWLEELRKQAAVTVLL